MSCHDILEPVLQKYYSALKSLYDFGWHSNLFDDMSNLDKFFSELRISPLLYRMALAHGKAWQSILIPNYSL